MAFRNPVIGYGLLRSAMLALMVLVSAIRPLLPPATPQSEPTERGFGIVSIYDLDMGIRQDPVSIS